MALQEYIIVEKRTPDKPEIEFLADHCGVSVADAFLAFFRLWCWLDSATADGHVPLLTRAMCDRRAGCKGIGEALALVGWIDFAPERGAVILGWERRNGQSAKKRAAGAARQRKHRGAK